MATNYKVLGQVAPGATALTTLYTVPASTQSICSTLAVCNRGATAAFRVAVIPSGQSLEDKHYIVYDNYVNQYDSIFLTLGVTLATGDIVRVYSSGATISYTLFGAEITA